MRAPDEPQTLTFCQTCWRWEAYPEAKIWPNAPAGLCQLTGESTLDVHLCGRHELERRIKTQRKLALAPPRPVVPAMGHCFSGEDLTCGNGPWGAGMCPTTWAQHRRDPHPCIFPHRYERGGEGRPDLAGQP